MQRKDFWKENGYKYETINADLKRLEPEQEEEYLKDLKTFLYDSGYIFETIVDIDSAVIERHPEYFVGLVKEAPSAISYIPQSVLKNYPELLESIQESVWKTNIAGLDVGNLPSEMARKYRFEICNSSRYYTFENVRNLNIETVRENPWLLLQIIEHMPDGKSSVMYEELPREIKEEYGGTLKKAFAIHKKIEKLNKVRARAAELEEEINGLLAPTMNCDDQKNKKGEIR